VEDDILQIFYVCLQPRFNHVDVTGL